MDIKEQQSIEQYLEKNLVREETLKSIVIDLIEDNTLDVILTGIGGSFLSSLLQTENPNGEPIEVTVPDEGNVTNQDAEKLHIWMEGQSEQSRKFQTLLRKYCEQNGYAEDYPRLYKKIEMDRRLFSRISSEAYELHIDKKTVFKLMIGLELTLEEAEELLSAAGFCFNHHKKYDLIIKYCIEMGIYETTRVDEYLVFEGEKALFSIGE